MSDSGLRTGMILRILVAHAAGLWISGVVTTLIWAREFNLLAGGLTLFLGGLLSLPWVVALLIGVWFWAPKLERHPVLFAIAGPILVTGSWTTLAGTAQAKDVAISCAASSIIYLGLWAWGHRPKPSKMRAG